MEVLDVVICGGGLAGQTLARQLKRAEPGLEIAILERVPRPLPAACHKVGESTVEVGAHYLAEDLGLKDYLERAQLPKLGLRFFYGNAGGPLEERPEFGATRFAPVPSYQLDRGVLENDLRLMNQEAGVRLLEDAAVVSIETRGQGPHEAVFRRQAGGESRLRARWMVDATGRRRLLQSRLGLGRANGHNASAAWFRLAGRFDVDDLVPADRAPWHARVPGRLRWFSTNHLMGRGYWVWLIPLSSGNTSVGIVADEGLHPFARYSDYGKALGWIEEHEPVLARALARREPLDFKSLRGFSYGAARVFGPRWACVGEAGLFTDPFYSPGSDFIAIGNTMVSRMIALDREGSFDEALAARYEELYFVLYEIVLEYYRGSYPLFGTARVMTAKHVWDWCLYWSFTAPLFFNGVLDDPGLLAEATALGRRYRDLNTRVQQLLRNWGARAKTGAAYGFLELFQIKPLRTLHLALRYRSDPVEALRASGAGLDFMEELEQVLAAQARLEAPTAGAVLTAAAAKGPSALRADLAAFLTEPTMGGS